ncbi:hypothetical protein LUZ60_006829 [Juncus effusus]|nr:hypothetical protein LUZ60_006829 [Juncus effusus]
MLSPPSSPLSLFSNISFTNPSLPQKRRITRVEMRDRSKNRRPTQRGRYLSSEAIQAVQSLKRSKSTVVSDGSVAAVGPKVQRLLKADMIAVMRELVTQQEPLLALLVFEELRKEPRYKPRLSMYTDLITVLARHNLQKELEQVCAYLKTEYYLETDIERFNLILGALLEFGFVHLTMDLYRLMKLWECEPDKFTYRILINGLELRGETDILQSVRFEAERRFGSLDFLEEKEEDSASNGL